MPDLLIITGSNAANAVTEKKRLVISEITISFIVKQYHNEISTRGLKMKKFLIFITCVLSTGAFAQQSYQQIGNQRYYQNGSSSQQIGNQTYYSNGTSAQQIGNQTYFSNGTSAQQIGNQTYYSNGVSAQQIGNQTYYSNGKSCQQIGNQTYCN